MKIVSEIDPCKTIEQKNELLLLNREQMLSGIKKNRVLVDPLKNYLIDLLESVRPVCLPEYQTDNRPKRVPQENQINELQVYAPQNIGRICEGSKLR